MYRMHIINRALGLLALAAILAMLLVACGGEEEPTAPAAAGQPTAPPTVEAMMEEATATPVTIPTATPIPEPTPVVLGDCRDGMRLQPGEGCRYTGGGSPQANVVLSVQHDGAICREGGPVKQEIGGITLNVDSLRLCSSGGFEGDDPFQSEIVASANADGSWTFYESALSASSARATPTPRPIATPKPTATPTPTPIPTVTSLEVEEMTPLTSIGEKVQLPVTANMSDGSSQVVESAQMQWQSSDPWVASVSEGIVTSVGAGNAMITAAYEGRRVEAPVSVRISTRSTGTVSVLYAIPSDREFRADYSEAITHAIVDLQSWYRRELGGLTFSLYEATPEECRMSQPADYYGTGHAWDKVVAAVQHCAPVQFDSPDFVWVIYPDAEESCEEDHELGAGRPGLTILHRGDLEGVTNPGPYFYCDEGPYDGTLGRWIGGLGHELGHTLGLPHPPGCDPWDPTTCDDLEGWSLMHVGYASYPDTYLLPGDKEILMFSHFVNPDLEPLTGPPATLGLDPFYEKYLDAGGLPIVASSRAPNGALFRAQAIVKEMLANRPDILAELGRLGKVLVIADRTEVLTDIPGYHDLYERFPDAEFDWNERHQGGGISGGTIGEPTVVWAQNIGCYEDDVFPNEDILVHEFAHTTMVVERQPGGKEFRSRLEAAYENALAAGLWENTYASTNPDEYWAEGVQSWFGLNDPPGPIHNAINTRAELEAYDPVLAGLIRETFGDVTVSASCHETIDINKQLRIQGVVVGPDGEPLEGIRLWAWQGETYNSRYGETGADGVFDIQVPGGSFTLDVYAVSGECSFVGWYDRAGSITTSRSQAARVVVDGASVDGIEIKLPASPDELRRIEWCSGG